MYSFMENNGHSTWQICSALLLSVLLSLACGSASSGEFEAALEAARRGDFAQAYCVWKPLALRGHAPSQYQVGWMYANGEGLAVDEEAAVRWWTAAALQGHTEAQAKLGMAYLYGEGVEEDHTKALEWFFAVAQKGDEDAQALVRRLAADGDEAALALVRRVLADGSEALGNGRRIRVARANVRAGPGKRFEVVTVTTKGRELVELSRSGDWAQVGLIGTETIAWVHTSLIEALTQAPDLENTDL